jgi:hypothetical protein
MKKYKYLILTGLILVALLGLSACKPAGPATPSAVEIATRVAETQMAKATEMAVEQMAIKLTELSKPTNTPMPTATPMLVPALAQPTAMVGTPAVSGTQTSAKPTTAAATPNPATNQSVKHWDKDGKCYFSFEFMGDIGGVQTGSTVKVGEGNTKTWRIKNTGTCAWSMDKKQGPDHFLYMQPEGGYTLFYPNGVNLTEVKLCSNTSDDIQPGDTCDVQVYFKALSEGKFYDYWNVMTPLKEFIGYGPNGNWSLGISVSAAN